MGNGKNTLPQGLKCSHLDTSRHHLFQSTMESLGDSEIRPPWLKLLDFELGLFHLSVAYEFSAFGGVLKVPDPEPHRDRRDVLKKNCGLIARIISTRQRTSPLLPASTLDAWYLQVKHMIHCMACCLDTISWDFGPVVARLYPAIQGSSGVRARPHKLAT
ncbi:hypothetical protein BJY01DRAFT_58628 [Aspergillus pseudoustus]|uniref:Fungal-type protein kinase domain-containing protein n=1 Tax=Aspergillus pseudoustus TaxID=1810923 RepID=A0ABR4KNJ8_9EURO